MIKSDPNGTFSTRFRNVFGRHQFPEIPRHREEPWPFKHLVRFCLKDFGAEHAQNTCKGCLKGQGCGPSLYITKKCSKLIVVDTILQGFWTAISFENFPEFGLGIQGATRSQSKLPLEHTFLAGPVRRAAEIYCTGLFEMTFHSEWISLNGG